MTASVLLLRHGETTWNRAGRQQGRGDSPLTARGLAQADALARAARLLRVGRVLASPLGRAAVTAGRVAAAVSLEPQTRDCLAEMDFGTCTGLTLDEIRTAHAGLLEAREGDRWHHRWPGGESYADVLERVRTGLAGDAPLFGAQPTVIVAHQSVNRALLHWLVGSPPGAALDGDQPADIVLRVDDDGTVWHARVRSTHDGAALTWWRGSFRRASKSARSRATRAA